MTSLEMTGDKPEISGRALVVGGGSIGQRHAGILRDIGMDVAQVSSHLPGAARSIDEALESGLPDYTVIASPTSRHVDDVLTLRDRGFAGPMLVEKPLFAPGQPVDGLPAAGFSVAYQLRFHPAIRWLKEQVGTDTALSVQAYVGQYLPTWRPDRDYRETESASAAAGGGALNDLSHELDLMDHLFDGWCQVAAMGGRDSALEIQTDDHFALLCRFARCKAATIELNYLDRAARRRIVVNTEEHTYEADLVQGFVRRDEEPPQQVNAERDGPIRDLHHSVLRGGDTATDPASALRTMALIEAALTSAGEARMVSAS